MTLITFNLASVWWRSLFKTVTPGSFCAAGSTSSRDGNASASPALGLCSPMLLPQQCGARGWCHGPIPGRSAPQWAWGASLTSWCLWERRGRDDRHASCHCVSRGFLCLFFFFFAVSSIIKIFFSAVHSFLLVLGKCLHYRTSDLWHVKCGLF